MTFDPSSDSLEADTTKPNAGRGAFRVSTAPVIPERNGTRHVHLADDLGLPRSYGMETLWLMPRDPHSLFAYWDIDWKAAFGEEYPRARKVHLRVLEADDSEHVTVEVEPMSGQCSVRVEKTDAAYHGEIGYLDPAGAWHVVSRSETVSVPPEGEHTAGSADFATVPLHLSFQRMLDATFFVPEENHSLTARLSALRKRAASALENDAITAEQHELVRAIEEAVARQPVPAPQGEGSPDLWAHHRLDHIFGVGNSSPSGGLGGSSRG